MEVTGQVTTVTQGQIPQIIPGITQKYDYNVEVFRIRIPTGMVELTNTTTGDVVATVKENSPVIGQFLAKYPGQIMAEEKINSSVIRKMTLTARPGMPLPPGCVTHMRIVCMKNTPRVPCSECQAKRKANGGYRDGDAICTHGKGGNGVRDTENQREVFSITHVRETPPTFWEVKKCEEQGIPIPPPKFEMEVVTKKGVEVEQWKYRPLPNLKATKAQGPMEEADCKKWLKWLLGTEADVALWHLINDDPVRKGKS